MIELRPTSSASAAVSTPPATNAGTSVMKKRRATARRKLKPCAFAFSSMKNSATAQAMIAAATQIGSQMDASAGTDSSADAASAVTPIAMQPLPGTVVNVPAASIVLRM